ncbi:SulP family inorganic anion transporter [Tenacibaculum sp. C7A-26P2]|uniref:SulP family inorganic anion transporter n=1 Tax=Tenacibaculum sp. C7A-26P2 TaxID=3447504 RepID=UPI003F869592
MKLIKKLIPVFAWLPSYKKEYLQNDIFAGITVAIVLIPQSIAYALIAGLPPIYGLYTALVPQVIYAVFGSSRQVAIGPVAMDSLIVATGVSTLALVGSESYISIAILLAMIVGSMQLLMGVFQLGFIVNFLSRPVITGFTSAVALTIGLNQFKNLLGVEFLQSDQIHILVDDIINRIQFLNIKTTIIGLLACITIFLFRKLNKKIPNALIVVTSGIILIKYFGDSWEGVDIVKGVPSGLPSFSIPVIDIPLIKELMPIALTLVMVGYLETISIGKTLEAKQDQYRVQPNQELIALGLSNILGSFFKAYPSASSFSRSAINAESNGKTGVAAFVSSILVMLTLLYLTPVFYYLPKSILAAIIIVAVFNLINIREARRLWSANNLDFWLLVATFFSTLVFGIEYGILVGVGLSLILLIYRTSRPYVTELGKVPNSDFYRNKNRFKEVLIDNQVLVFRFDAQLFYANAGYFRDKLEEMTGEKGAVLKLIVLDAESINRVDSTGVDMLIERIRFYKKKEITFYLAGVKGPVRDALFRGGVLDEISIDHFFMRANGAVHYFKTGDNLNQKKYAQYIHQAYR